jgi:hypothetical protein
VASVLSTIFLECISGELIPVTRPVTTLMAIGAQGYSIGDAIRTLPGQVLEVMYFKKWQTVHCLTCFHKKSPECDLRAF